MTKANGQAIERVGLYARVSTLDKGQDPEMQLRELRAYAAQHGWAVFDEYTDKGVSGVKDSRPQLNRLMADAQTRKFDAVLVWKLDRFSRSLKHLIMSLDVLTGSQVAFVSLRDNIDMTTAAGQLMVHIIAAFAQFERAIIQERVRAGLANARAKGKQIGRKAREDVNAGEIAKLRIAGKSWAQIGEITGIPQTTCFRVHSKNLAKSA